MIDCDPRVNLEAHERLWGLQTYIPGSPIVRVAPERLSDYLDWCRSDLECSGVYAIRWVAKSPEAKAGKWLYVGQSRTLGDRLRSHFGRDASNTAFGKDRALVAMSAEQRTASCEVCFARFPADQLNAMEALFIGHLRPTENWAEKVPVRRSKKRKAGRLYGTPERRAKRLAEVQSGKARELMELDGDGEFSRAMEFKEMEDLAKMLAEHELAEDARR